MDQQRKGEYASPASPLGNESASMIERPGKRPPTDNVGRIVRLGVWQEVVGVLKEVDRDRGLLRFNLRFVVAVPPEHLLRMPEIEALIGKRVALLRTDLLSHPLILRPESRGAGR